MFRFRAVFLLWISTTALLGCSSNDGAASGSGGMGPTDAGGDAVGGSAGSGANAGSAGGGQAGSGGSSGASGSAGQDAGPVTCANLGSDNVRFVDQGAELREFWETSSVGGTAEVFIHEKRNRGYVWLLGSFPNPPYDAPPGSYPVSLAGMLAPTTSSKPGNVTCFASATLEVDANGKAVSSTLGKSLGACPGNPVAGSISICSGSSCSGPPVSGSIEGHALTDVNVGPSIGSTEGYVDLFTQEITMRAFTDKLPALGSTGNVDFAIIFTRPNSAFGGAVYCAGAGSTWDNATGLKTELKSLSKLGNCVGAPGAVEVLACL
ncbi:MAG: hypothetical protein R3B13_10980 [Polyangiaceae bacterium]